MVTQLFLLLFSIVFYFIRKDKSKDEFEVAKLIIACAVTLFVNIATLFHVLGISFAGKKTYGCIFSFIRGEWGLGALFGC